MLSVTDLNCGNDWEEYEKLSNSVLPSFNDYVDIDSNLTITGQTAEQVLESGSETEKDEIYNNELEEGNEENEYKCLSLPKILQSIEILKAYQYFNDSSNTSLRSLEQLSKELMDNRVSLLKDVTITTFFKQLPKTTFNTEISE